MEAEDCILLDVVKVYDTFDPIWYFLNIPKSAPPQKIIELSEESMQMIRKIAPHKIIHSAPSHIFVICKNRDVIIPTGSVPFYITKTEYIAGKKNIINIEYFIRLSKDNQSSVTDNTYYKEFTHVEPKNKSELWVILSDLMQRKEKIDIQIKNILFELKKLDK